MIRSSETKSDQGEPERRLQLRTFEPGQGTTIGDEIELSVLAIMGDRVRIAIEMPRSAGTLPTDRRP